MVRADEDFLIEVNKKMDEIVDRIFQLSQERLIEDNKIDTGTLLKTANVNRRFLEKEIVYPAIYADIVEFGRNPGQMPPVDALIKWVRRKLNIKDEREARNTAFAIAVSIKKRGIDPSPYLQPAVDKVIDEFGR